jgi:polyphosphate glucokinase
MSRILLGVDVGGSSVKAGLVDVEQGILVGELVSAPTPRVSTPDAVVKVVAGLGYRLQPSEGPIGVALPSVIKHGKVRTAANIDASWLGVDGATLVRESTGRSAVLINDADAAGVAEMRWGAGQGHMGPVVMLTFGTGIGSALFIEGRLYPNAELGHLQLHGMDAEKFASARVRTELGLDFPGWIARVNEYLERMHALLWPDIFILGGAVSEHFDEFAPLLRSEAEIRPAHFAGQAGVIGAALAAAE